MKCLILCFLACSIAIFSIAQCPPNIDFEEGTLDHWQCKIGYTSSNGIDNFITLSDTTPIPGRHEIISENSPIQKDPYGGFPTLCPYGGNYSVKLGNEMVGAEAEGISYTFTIPLNVDTLTFTYFYAVVFEDPSHDPYDQPRFFVTAYDVQTGDVINCASYNYVSTASLPGFTPSKVRSNVLYKDWSPVSLQFFGLNGRDVRLEFKTADCVQTGHFGYAYLDVGTGCSNILATAPYCVETNSLILNAPYGFKDYTWYNQDYSQIVGTGQSITFTPPPANTGSFFVDMIPYPGFGCRDTASATVKPLPVPEPPVTDSNFFCQLQSPEPMTATPLRGHDLLWYTDETGGLPLSSPPVPSTWTVDTIEYYVSQKKLFGCESFRAKQTAVVRPTPSAQFNLPDAVQCQDGNEFSFINTSGNLSNPKFYWDFGDGQIDSSGNSVVKHSYKDFGMYYIKLTALNQPACGSEAMTTVSVMPKPVAQFDSPPVICEQNTSFTLTDRSYVPNGFGAIADWKWSVDGVVYSSQNLPLLIASHGGSIPADLVVATVNGCVSDTLKKVLPVRHKPVAAFDFKNVLCENETIKLTDHSAIPSAVDDEYVDSWYWTFDGHRYTTRQHPAEIFEAGVHNVKLVANSNFGCKSDAQEKSIVVHPKPYVDLSINDSCVFKEIVYTVSDLSGNVRNWYWNFGDGWQTGVTVIRKRFMVEGDESFTLMSTTDKGCKDTINRAFVIYDNDSEAGRDTVVAKNQPVYLDAKGGKNVNYTWTPSVGLSDPNSEKPIATLDRDITYTLYSVTDKGCEKTTDIFIKRYVGAEIYIPNAFTPNADGKNDVLKVFPVGFKSFDYMAIYNRYGQQVFFTKDWNKGWDGTVNGNKQDAGNYVVVTKMIDYNGNVMVRKGNLVLVR
ncbi:MAG: gliding motility-associated C-terminal domain-containing protein [Chitinophagaceae bacterium]|nr:gliding motility-associated C-terminal domain-containing protein [Chitinophagaceae bacterium]